jgi:hypothetical protein
MRAPSAEQNSQLQTADGPAPFEIAPGPTAWIKMAEMRESSRGFCGLFEAVNLRLTVNCTSAANWPAITATLKLEPDVPSVEGLAGAAWVKITALSSNRCRSRG